MDPKEPTQASEESRVKLITRKELLVQYHNAHLRQLMAEVVNLEAFNKSNDGDVFAIVPVNGPTGQTTRKITIKEQKAATLKQIQQQTLLLSVMEKLLADEGMEVPKESNGAQYGGIQGIPKS